MTPRREPRVSPGAPPPPGEGLPAVDGRGHAATPATVPVKAHPNISHAIPAVPGGPGSDAASGDPAAGPVTSPAGSGYGERVAAACRDRYPGAVVRMQVEHPGRPAFLDVEWRDEQGILLRWPVGLAPGGLDDEVFERFVAAVHTGYARDDPLTQSEFVSDGDPADENFMRRARQRRVKVWSLAEYERRWDPRRYLAYQAEWLAADRRYLPELYVPQGYRLLGDLGQPPAEQPDLLEAMSSWLGVAGSSLLLVLGDFGSGKSFLLRQLARRIPAELPYLVPMLVELRDLDKVNDLDVLLAQHLAKAGETRIEPRAVRQMLARGQIALLFDGFDELAIRVTYDEAAAHLRTVLSAVADQAKVVLTSRTQHFSSDDQWRTALGQQVRQVATSRQVRITDFDEPRVRAFLVNLARLQGGRERDAEERLALIRGIEDLSSLSRNPRMLSFIAALPAEDLHAVKNRTGQISSADVYRLLVDTWLDFEVDRRFPAHHSDEGSHDTRRKYRAQMRAALDTLALTLWGTLAPGVDVARLEATAAQTLTEWRHLHFNMAQAAHALGSGSLLVRNDDDTFSFIHFSVIEYLVAAQAAARLADGSADVELVAVREMSPLMADFFCGIAGRDAALSWAQATATAAHASPDAKANALAVGRSLGVELTGIDLARQDLRSRDLTDRDLAGADLTGVILVGARLRGTNLTGATLVGADLSYTELDGVMFAGADLTDADFTGATVRRGTLRGARLGGSRWACAALVGTDVDPDSHLAGNPLSKVIRADVEPAEAVIEPMTPEMRDIAFSVDGAWLAAAGADVVLFDIRTRRVVRVFPGHLGWVSSVRFSPGGTRLATAGDDGTARIWDAATGQLVCQLTGHRGAVRSLAFSPDGTRLATGGDDRVVRIWDAASGRHLHDITGHTAVVRAVDFAPGGTRLATAGDDGTARIWDAATGQLVCQLTGHRGAVRSLAFSPDGTRLATAGDDRVVRIWDAASGRHLHDITGHTAVVRAVDFAPGGTRLATAGDDGTARIWDAATGLQLHQLTGHREPSWSVLSVGFAPDGARLATGGDDGTACIWDTATGTLEGQLTGHRGPTRSVLSVGFAPDGARLATGGDDGTACIWDTATGTLEGQLTGHRGPTRSVLSVGFAPDGARLATGGDDGTACIWDTATRRRRHQLAGRDGPVWSVVFDPTGTHLATGSDTGTTCIWESATGKLVHRLAGHDGPVWSVVFDPAGTRLASGSADGTARIWDVASGRELHQLTGHDGWVSSLGFDPAGTRLASGADGIIQVWNTATGRLTHRLTARRGLVWSVRFDPAGASLTSVGADGTVHVWDALTGRLLRQFTGHDGRGRSVGVDQAATRIASGGADGTIRVWDFDAGTLLATLLALPDGGWATLLPDGSYKLDGKPSGRFWWVIGLHRFEPGEPGEPGRPGEPNKPGELDGFSPNVRRLAVDEPLPGALGNSAPGGTRRTSPGRGRPVGGAGRGTSGGASGRLPDRE